MDDVLIAPAFVGICGTDLHVLHGRHAVQPPLVIGHEMAGTVLVPGLGARDLQPGDHVALNPVRPCGECPRCRRGKPNICDRAQIIGFRLPGAAQTAMLVPRSQLHLVPAGVPLRHAALAEPLSVAVHAVGRVPELDDVLVIGGGTVGLCIAAVLRASGAGSVTLIEPVAAKRDLALRLGVTQALPPGALDETGRFTGCLDVVASQATLDLAASACASGGTVVMVGTAHGPAAIDLHRLQRYEIALQGSSIFLDADMRRALHLLATSAVDADLLITGVRPIDEAAAAYADAEQPGNVKTLIAMAEMSAG